jgi:hypothetical protein
MSLLFPPIQPERATVAEVEDCEEKRRVQSYRRRGHHEQLRASTGQGQDERVVPRTSHTLISAVASSCFSESQQSAALISLMRFLSNTSINATFIYLYNQIKDSIKSSQIKSNQITALKLMQTAIQIYIDSSHVIDARA